MKNPVFVAILNFLTLGLGTALLGKRVGVGLLLTVAGAFLRYEELRIAPAVTGRLDPHWILMFIGMGLAGIAAGADAYREARGVLPRVTAGNV